MEGKPQDWQVDFHRFDRWVAERFRVEEVEAGFVQIIRSYTSNEEEAFYKCFELIQEFCSEQTPELFTKPISRRYSFLELLKAIRSRPAMYIGSNSFQGLYSFLMGDERAHSDLGIQCDEGREEFRAFTKWIESNRNKALARPWYNVILFYSRFRDEQAFSLFFKWLDDYARDMRTPDFFRGKPIP